MRHFSLQTRTRFSLAVISIGMVFCIFTPLTTVLHAATEDFIVTSLIGGDSTPPSIPGAFSATPIASTQIDLTWTASTDNYLLSGYHVWRDNVQIATTTNLVYSDTGLTASTTYIYYVTAYDSFFNESASSTVVSTTTPDTPPPPPTPTTTASSSSSGTGTWFRPLADAIISIEIIPYKDSVVIRYETRYHVRSVMQWGRTQSYELGSLAEGAFSRTHETRIVGLSPATLYRFIIEGENSIGREGTMYSGTFTTLPPDDIFPPGNVLNLTAVRDGIDVVLSWENPDDPDLTKIRVVRNNNFYPSDIADGWVVYEGLGTGIRDTEVFNTDEVQYYTVFTYDNLGNISSGAVVSVTAREDITLPPLDPEKNEIDLRFEDVAFYQEGMALVPLEMTIGIDGAKQLTISIPYERLPEHLKTILITIGDSADSRKTFTFLLRINADKTAYVGTLAPFGNSGNFPITITVFDFKTAQVGYARGTLVSSIDPIHTDSGFETTLMSIIRSMGSSYLVWFIALLLLLVLNARRLAQMH